MSKIYLAHPITGLKTKEVFDYYDTIAEELKNNHIILSPMTGKDYLRNETIMQKNYENYPISNGHAIFERDMWMVSSADIILCDFTGTENISIGCCFEMAVAAKLGKHTVLVMQDGNAHDHRFMREAADIIFNNIEEALNYIKQLP